MNWITKQKIKLIRKIRKISEEPDIGNSEHHNTVSSIFRMSLRNSHTELLLSPGKNKRIVRLEDKSLYIILEKCRVEVINTSVTSHTEIPYALYVSLAKLFDQRLDAFIEKSEREMMNKVDVELNKVLKKLNKKDGRRISGTNDKRFHPKNRKNVGEGEKTL